MKIRCALPLLILALALLLPGCGQRGLDAETQALAEASDAVCMVQFRVTELVHAPDGLEGNWQTTQDGTKWAHLLTFRLTAAFFALMPSDRQMQAQTLRSGSPGMAAMCFTPSLPPAS